MKLRHAAALALVGWYLMIPPLTQIAPDSYKMPRDTSAPLSKWFRSPVDHFDTLQDCEAELASRREALAMAARLNGTTWYPAGEDYATNINGADYERIKVARCVASNDPGLKSK